MTRDPSSFEPLEPAQRAASTERLPRRKLGPGTLSLLLLLRVYVLLAIPIVGYAFVHALTVHRG